MSLCRLQGNIYPLGFEMLLQLTVMHCHSGQIHHLNVQKSLITNQLFTGHVLSSQRIYKEASFTQSLWTLIFA